MASTRYCTVCLTTFRGDPSTCPNLGCASSRPSDGWGNLLEEGDLLDRHYRILRVLAVGGAGLTYLAREVGSDGVAREPDLAIKVLYTARSGGSFVRRLATEAQILQELDHDHIVRCRGFVHRAGTEPYLVTLFEHGGSLGQVVADRGPTEPFVAAGILRQVLLALDVAHQRGVVHRDLKPDNILISEQVPADQIPHVRVADFGIAKVSGGLTSRLTKAGAFVGTPEFAAPEQFENRAPSPATDVFAAGAVLFYLLAGRPPVAFSRRTDLEATYEELLDSLPPRLDPALCPDLSEPHREVFQSILDHTMVADAEARWTVQQILARLASVLGKTGSFTVGNTLELTTDQAPEREARPPVDHTAEHRPVPEANASPTPAPSVEGTEAPTASPPPADAGWISWTVGALGASGTVVVLGLGLPAVVAGWLLAAWWLGATGSTVTELDPLVLRVSEVRDVQTAPVLLGGSAEARAARLAVQAQLQGHGASLAETCQLSGPLVVGLVVDREGEVVEAVVDPGYGRGSRCVEEQLLTLTVRNPLGRAARVRAGLLLP